MKKKINATVSIVTIGPEEARKMLEHSVEEQRKTRPGAVNRYASDMIAGRWKLGPDALVEICGQQANGKHRLTGVIKSGTTQQFILLESDDPELFKIIDCGLKRTVADGLLGVQNGVAIAASARWLIDYEAGVKIGHFAHGGGSGRIAREASQIALIEYCEENMPAIQAAVGYTLALYKKSKILPGSIGASIHVIASKANERDAAERFLRQVYTDGGNNIAGDLRNKLIGNLLARSRMRPGYIFKLTLKTFNLFLAGKRPMVLRVGDDEVVRLEA